ncbi:flavorubredoxin [Clostridium pascui]|uniref:MBL fold metallo-hydrolase n=1 Tax=Clostridium pascui TaxID=46609 RepID=UPI00195BAB79|nr:MBL fold metallo-hydrolase [Clostridium pascui]MBM7871340.1 flavorubredoxin [Clostridium pascui]
MNQIKIFDSLYMFNTYNELINLSFNQFLLIGEKPILIHTGSYQMTEELIPKLKSILGDKKLSYVFVSHFESDECGGLTLLLKHYPEAICICSAITARQLTGFGMDVKVKIAAPKETLSLAETNLSFISYPSEMHLWDGLLAFETKKGLLFSSDLFIRMGKLEDSIVSSNLKNEVSGIVEHQIPSPAALKILQNTLYNLSINYIVPGHGPVLKL